MPEPRISECYPLDYICGECGEYLNFTDTPYKHEHIVYCPNPDCPIYNVNFSVTGLKMIEVKL